MAPALHPAGPEVCRAWKAVRTLGEACLAEAEETVQRHLSDRDEMEALSREELGARLERDDVLVLDVRPNLRAATCDIYYRFDASPTRVVDVSAPTEW